MKNNEVKNPVVPMSDSEKENQEINFLPEPEAYIKNLIREFDLIPMERRGLLQQLTDYIVRKNAEGQRAHLLFICTHNSRRSHIAQIWATVAAAWYDLNLVDCYSGGTEVTAFNPRAVSALKRAGFIIDHKPAVNPHYLVKYSPASPYIRCFSKVYDDPVNPQENFAAIMTCSDADENCPYIPGAETRIRLTYEDPKAADDTGEETQRYDERVREIGREIFYAFSLVMKTSTIRK